jgi:hypothetical protein
VTTQNPTPQSETAGTPATFTPTTPGLPGETAGTDQPTEPTAAPGPVIAPASADPSTAPMPGTGPTDTTPAPDEAPAAETDPFDGAELVEVSERGFTFRQTFPDGGVGLITLSATLADQGGGTFGLTLAHPNAATD